MTFKNALLVLLASLALAPSAFAVEAGYTIYGIAGNPRPAPLPDPDEGQEPEPTPQPPQEDIEELKTIIVQRRLINMSADLRYLAGIDSRYRGYVVDSVIVDVRGSAGGTALDLVIDNRVEQAWMNPYGRVILYPRVNMQIDRDIHSLLVGVRGLADIDAIHINLRKVAARPTPPTTPNPPPTPEKPDVPDRVTVPMYVNQRIVGNGMIFLNQFFDTRKYQGYKIFSMEIDAQSVYQNAMLDLLVNNRTQGPTQMLGPYPRRYTVYPTNAEIGRDNIMLNCRGDQQVGQIMLRLQRN